jgi:3',5'-cyclic AMP phosphodiesterase CpdA
MTASQGPRSPRWLVTLIAIGILFIGTACRRSPEPEPPPVRTALTEIRELDPPPGVLALPIKSGSIRFAVIGDAGRGDKPQYEVAQQMFEWRRQFPFEFVLMLGDNIYDSHTPRDYQRKFEEPYKALLDAGVTFYAAIGNHDDPAQIFYEKFNMQGRRYYTFRKSEGALGGLTGAGVRFFVLDSRSFDKEQLQWLSKELAESGSAWKICYFHHPLYTSGRYRAGARALRLVVEPILVAGEVDVVLAGHEHFYERIHPQRGITYFVSGAAGSLRRGDIRPSGLTATGFDQDYHFMLIEITGNELYFQAISRKGETVDAGVMTRPAR